MGVQTDIEVLKSEVHGLYKAVSDVASKIDMLLALQVQLVRLQEQHDSTRQALDRSFETIREVRKKADLTKSELDMSVAKVRGGMWMGAILGAILFGSAQWYMLQQLDSLQSVAKQANKFNTRLTVIERAMWPDK